MPVYEIDPIKDARWSHFVCQHAKSSVFHTVGWLEALRGTYGYQPVAFTTSPPGDEIRNGIVCCDISSWLTGRRLVSLPFSDHCEPLCDSAADLNSLIQSLQSRMSSQGWKYLEFRPTDWNLGETCTGVSFVPGVKYFLHAIDLSPSLEEVFKKLDKDSVQRRIRHADRAGLIEKCGNSQDLLGQFYKLFVMTRGRHHLPPIPLPWFRNLIHNLGDALEIRLAYMKDEPIAAILTLRFRDVLFFKYGCSNPDFNKFGATPWLLWNAIVAGKSSGAIKFDLGRTQENNAGLIAFKNNWATSTKPLVYWTFPETPSFDSVGNWKMKMAMRVFSCMPDSLLTLTGRLIYRHIG